MGAFWAEKVEFFCQKGLQFVKQSAILICVANRRRNYARLAQLVEHLLDVQEVTGSSPVPRTLKDTWICLNLRVFCFIDKFALFLLFWGA